MKKNYKNTTIFDYQYLDMLSDYLKKETLDQESKIALLRRLLHALVATAQGEQHEHYKYLKKNLTEHKAMEYIIELLVKKEYPALQAMSFDYSQGIFEVFRLHNESIRAAIISIINRELTVFLMTEAPLIEDLMSCDHFDHYTEMLNNLFGIRQLSIDDLEPLTSQSCEHTIGLICMLCDGLKDAFNNNLITDSKYAVVVHYVLEHNQDMLGYVWGTIRLQFLTMAVARRVVDLLKAQKEPLEVAATVQDHHDACDCQEHSR